jgi:uncharacterized protein with FMN-binding domain
MKKIVTIAVVLIIAAYIIYQNGSSWLLYILTYTTGKGSQVPVFSASSSPKPPYKDGAFTGNSEGAYYGNVQVKAIISGGKITDVQFLQHPHDAARSLAINTLAMPNLTQEAIRAQNAQVDIVSGATDTSNAFMQSLSSALAQAK